MTPEYKTLSEKSSVSLHHKRRQLEAEGWTPAGEVVETPRQMIYDIENHTETIQYRYTLVMSRNDHKYRNDQIKFARSQTQLISQINAVFTTHAKEDFGHDFSKGAFCTVCGKHQAQIRETQKTLENWSALICKNHWVTLLRPFQPPLALSGGGCIAFVI